jgi:tRNA dimethylallyltransferase
VILINNVSTKKPLIAIVGPTGAGKSRLAVHLAQKFNGEIVNGDSRQVYRYMDIGTAKPIPEERTAIPHHLYDIVNPDESFSLAQYQELVDRSIKDIQERGKLPLLVGGSGQYIWAILEGWAIPRIVPDPEYRKKLESIAASRGAEELYRQLLDIDPTAAQKIDQRNIRRVIRALEVSHQTDKPISELQKKKAPDYKTLIIGLTTERAELYRRIDERVDAMIHQGLIGEVEKLNQMGYSFDLPAMSSIGYKQIGMMLRGEINREEAIRQIKTDNHRFVRHQYAWFRLQDERIHWFNVQTEIEAAIGTLIADYYEMGQ